MLVPPQGAAARCVAVCPLELGCVPLQGAARCHVCFGAHRPRGAAESAAAVCCPQKYFFFGGVYAGVLFYLACINKGIYT